MKQFNITIYSLFLSVCLMSFNIPCINQDVTVHVILCGATQVDDIGAGVGVSLKLMKNAMEYVKSQINVTIEYYELNGNNFEKSHIVSVLKDLYVNSNDVILFYSTSHGFNYNNGISKYPFIGAHPTKKDMTQEEFDVYGLSLEKEVMKTLQKKGARLTIAMAEACNTIIDIPTPKRYNAMNVNIGKRLEELFIYESGSLIASSSVIDQRSWTDDKDGGIYTNMFINALNEVISWSDLDDEEPT